MTRHGSASSRKPESNVPRKQESAVQHNVASGVAVVDAHVKRRARLLITNGRIPFQTRGLIRYALGLKDPYLPQLVRRVESGEMVIDYLEKIDTPFGKRPAP